MICCSLPRSSVLPRSLNRDSRRAPLNGAQSACGAGGRRVALVDVRGGRVVDRRVPAAASSRGRPSCCARSRVDRDALQALLVVLVDRDVGGEGVEPGARVVDPHLAGAGGVQHPQVGQHGEAHRLAGAVVEGHLLERGLVGGHRRRREVAGVRGGGQRRQAARARRTSRYS